MKNLFLLALLFAFSAVADTNTLTDRASGETITASFFNDIHDALSGTVVPRNSSGVPTTAGGDLGSGTYRWGGLYSGTGDFSGTVTLPAGSITSTIWNIGASAGTSTHPVNGRLSLIRGAAGPGSDGNLLLTDVTTDATTKNSSIGARHYTNSEENVGIFSYENNASANILYIGTGGTSSQNAATRLDFYTAATNTTTLGTLKGQISAAGLWTIGAASGTQAHVVNGTLDIMNSTAGVGSVGTIRLADITTDGTEKQAIISLRHKTNSEENVALFYASGFGSDNTLYIGGGAGASYNALTKINFYTAATTTTTGGTLQGSLSSAGLWTLGASGGTQTHIVNGQSLRLNYATAGSNVILQARHSDNTSGSSSAQLYLETGGSSGGDPKVNYFVTGGQDWAHGIDNSDSDSYVISNSANLGTNNGIKIDTSLNVYAPGGDIVVTGDTTSLAKFRGNAASLAVAAADPSTNTLNFGTNAAAMFMVVDGNTGRYAGFTINGGGTLITKLWGEATWTVSSGTAASINVTNSAGTVTFQNKTGSALDLRVVAMTPN